MAFMGLFLETERLQDAEAPLLGVLSRQEIVWRS
jgi:hypothetical protein